MGRRRDALQLSRSQHRTLTQYLADEHLAPRQVNRARVLLCWDAGLSSTDTARQLGLTERGVYALRRAFRRQGLSDYLTASPRGGAPTKITPRVTRVLAQLVAQVPARPWSLRRLAAHLVRQGCVASISTVTVAKALSGLEPDQTRPFFTRGQKADK